MIFCSFLLEPFSNSCRMKCESRAIKSKVIRWGMISLWCLSSSDLGFISSSGNIVSWRKINLPKTCRNGVICNTSTVLQDRHTDSDACLAYGICCTVYKPYVCSALPGWKYGPSAMWQLVCCYMIQLKMNLLLLHLDWDHLSPLQFSKHIGVCTLYMDAMVAHESIWLIPL